MNASTATAYTPLRQAWPRVSRGQRTGSPFAASTYYFKYALGLSGLRMPVAHGVLAVSSRTIMNMRASRVFSSFRYNKRGGERILKASEYHPGMLFPRGRHTVPLIASFVNGDVSFDDILPLGRVTDEDGLSDDLLPTCLFAHRISHDVCNNFQALRKCVS